MNMAHGQANGHWRLTWRRNERKRQPNWGPGRDWVPPRSNDEGEIIIVNSVLASDDPGGRCTVQSQGLTKIAQSSEKRCTAFIGNPPGSCATEILVAKKMTISAHAILLAGLDSPFASTEPSEEKGPQEQAKRGFLQRA